MFFYKRVISGNIIHIYIIRWIGQALTNCFFRPFLIPPELFVLYILYIYWIIDFITESFMTQGTIGWCSLGSPVGVWGWKTAFFWGVGLVIRGGGGWYHTVPYGQDDPLALGILDELFKHSATYLAFTFQKQSKVMTHHCYCLMTYGMCRLNIWYRYINIFFLVKMSRTLGILLS